MEPITARTIELKFGGESERAGFPTFCNSIISLEGPQETALPVLTTRQGPDGGIDGEWDLSQTTAPISSSLACRGWNVYQYKTLDVVSKGRGTMCSRLCSEMRGAVAKLIARSESRRAPELYVLFTNLTLGLQTTSKTATGKRLNAIREKLRASILKGSPPNVRVEIIDAGMLSGILSKYPFLQLAWFRTGLGTSWDQMDLRERIISRVAIPLIGRDKELSTVKNLLCADATRVIAISGPNGIGKTRLALEATKGFQGQTVFIENPAEILNCGLGTFTSAQRTAVVVLEDPAPDVATRLAEQALGSSHPVKLLMTLPSARNAPVVRLADDARNAHCKLLPLDRSFARQILDHVNPKLENRIRDWIIYQAGGIPGVLTDAALYGEKLWKDRESLREGLTRKYRERVRRQTGSDSALNLLDALAPLAYVFVGPDSADLRLLLDEFQIKIAKPEISRMLKQMEELGYLRRRGDFVAVMPAMFAGGLFEDILKADPELPIRLYQRSERPTKNRLLERLVPLDIPETNSFWQFMFGPEGPFDGIQSFIKNIDVLEYLARAVPIMTANFLARNWDGLVKSAFLVSSEIRRSLLGVLMELLEDSVAIVTAFELLIEFVEMESVEEVSADTEAALQECFVYWYSRSLPYPVREGPIRKWLNGGSECLKNIAARVVVAATKPPHSLSGRSVQTRSLGSEPVYGTWGDIFAFLERMIELRLQLCASNDEQVRNIARDGIASVISELFSVLPLPRAVNAAVAIASESFVMENPIALKESIRWVRDRLGEEAGRVERKRLRGEIKGALESLDRLLRRINRGSYSHRLRLAVGRTHDYEERDFEGQKLYEYQIRILRLVREAVHRKKPLGRNVWDIFEDEKDVVHVFEFFAYLGERDVNRREFPFLLEKATSARWASFLAFYFCGAAVVDSGWVDKQNDLMLSEQSRFGVAILLSVCRRDPSRRSRQQLRVLLKRKGVAPDIVGRELSSGRWLQQIPPREVAVICEYIGSGQAQENTLATVASQYLHPGRPLPRELFPVMLKTLSARRNALGIDGYHFDQIALGVAQTDLNAGFTLLKDILLRLSNSGRIVGPLGWNPFESHGSMRFWEFLRNKKPNRAYKVMAGANNITSWAWNGMRRGGTILNLAAHSKFILRLAVKKVEFARVFAACLVFDQPGFHEFVSVVIGLYPGDALLNRYLEKLFVEDFSFGVYGGQLKTAKERVNVVLAGVEISAEYRGFLEAVSRKIESRIREMESASRSDEPLFYD